jgi:hypothetical protein
VTTLHCQQSVSKAEGPLPSESHRNAQRRSDKFLGFYEVLFCRLYRFLAVAVVNRFRSKPLAAVDDRAGEREERWYP